MGKPTVCSRSFHLCASIHSCFISSNKFFNSLVHQYLTHHNTDNEKGDQGLNYTYWDQNTLLSVFWSCFRMLATQFCSRFVFLFLFIVHVPIQKKTKTKTTPPKQFCLPENEQHYNIILGWNSGNAVSLSLISLSQSHIPVPTLSKTLFHPWNTFASYILEIVRCHSAIRSKAQPHSRAKVFGISK